MTTDQLDAVKASEARQTAAHADVKAASDAIRQAKNSTTLAGGKLLRFSPLSHDFENALSHSTSGEDWAKGATFVAIPITTNQGKQSDAKQACRFDAMRGFVDDKGNIVYELPYGVADLLGTTAGVRSFVATHMATHAKAIAKAITGDGVHDTDSLTGKAKAKALAVSSAGRHNASFKAFGSDYFTKFTKSETREGKGSDNRPLVMQPAHVAKMKQFIWNESAWKAFAPLAPSKPDDEGKRQVKWILHTCPKHAKVLAKFPETSRYSYPCPAKVAKATCGTKLVPAAKVAKAKAKKAKATK